MSIAANMLFDSNPPNPHAPDLARAFAKRLRVLSDQTFNAVRSATEALSPSAKAQALSLIEPTCEALVAEAEGNERLALKLDRYRVAATRAINAGLPPPDWKEFD